MDKPTTKTRELLNQTGFPFQHYCAHEIANLPNFQLGMEVAYTYPPTNGPLLGIHGQIDILAVCPDESQQMLVCFIIECKKASEKIKNWILLPNKQQRPKWPTFIFTPKQEGPSFHLGVTRGLTFPKLGYTRGRDYDYSVSGIELNTSQSAVNRESEEKIYKPLKQVAHASRAFEASPLKIVEGIEYFRTNQIQQTVYIPVVLTTANIFLADFPLGKISEGEILENDLQLSEPKKWTSFEFPLPDYMSYELLRDQAGTHISKRTIFVVNYQFLSEFFSGALEACKLDAVPTE